MFLKTLTLKGFKSFAEPTTLQMEPGITVVVGPNGSGKSNVVDAIAWVLGAQGPRVVRSAKMDDVIFAGTSSRPPLGRAEVSLTIDNSARRLPIEFNEVTVTRTLFRTGESEYAINGVACRLLDVQELLSDSGVGRQQHVIIGQGQLDAILSARPEDRRAVIEEAAGVLKYRRRRERAERRLEASEGSLARLEDLVREVRRQIRPLERQAAAARRHAALVEESRAVRLYVLGREVAELEQQLARAAEETGQKTQRSDELVAELARLDRELAARRAALGQLDLSGLDGRAARARELRERAAGLLARCEERRRAQAELAEVLGATSALERLQDEQLRIQDELAGAEAAAAELAPEWAELEQAEARFRAEEASELERIAELEAPPALPGTLFAAGDPVAVDQPASADRPGPAAGPGAGGDAAAPSERSDAIPTAEARRAAAAASQKVAAARAADARLAERAASQREQHLELVASLEHLRASLSSVRLDAEAAGVAASQASTRESDAAEAAAAADEVWRAAQAAHQAAAARVEALELALDEARARAGLERLAPADGVLGTVPDLVEVADGVALALEAALEPVLDTVLVRAGDEARRALELLRAEAAGGAVLPVQAGAVPATAATAGPAEPVPVSCEWLRPLVRSVDADVEALLDRLLAGVVLCREGFEAAITVALESPAATVVTLEGDRFSATGWRVGAGRGGATRAALERARRQEEATAAGAMAAATASDERAALLAAARRAASEAERESERLGAALAQLEHAERETAGRVASLHAQLRTADDEAAAAASVLAEAERELAGADDVLARSEEAERQAALRRDAAQREAARLRDAAEREAARRREQAAQARRLLEERARALLVLRRDLEVRAAALEERRAMLERRAGELELQVATQRGEVVLAEDRRAASAVDGEVVARLASVAHGVLGELDGLLAELGPSRERLAGRAAGLRGEVERLEGARALAEQARVALGERLQRLEVEQAEARVRHESALQSLGRDLGATAAEALEAPEPDSPTGTSLAEHLRRLDEQLQSLGPVNPLAMQELSELEERHGFLQAQLEDVKGARRDLREVIRGVDAEIVAAFGEAFDDVAEHFSRLVSTLFPGGDGRLVLSAPEDLLSTGVEIEARPPGRNVRRLSLLSGGERSLVALAFLFAVFRSRPSPFYVMDEVEAALDEVNLRRFLGLLEDFRDEAQLIVVSHQKKTMEIADALYGVTMQAGGATKVVSERLRRNGTTPAAAMPALEPR